MLWASIVATRLASWIDFPSGSSVRSRASSSAVTAAVSAAIWNFVSRAATASAASGGLTGSPFRPGPRRVSWTSSSRTTCGLTHSSVPARSTASRAATAAA